MPVAAQPGDNHTCPSTSPKPHGGGPVLPGEQEFRFKSIVVARIFDEATCSGDTDILVTKGPPFRYDGLRSIAAVAALSERP